MPNTIPTIRLPFVTISSSILFLLTFLPYHTANILLEHEFYTAARILFFLGTVPNLALFLVSINGLLGSITYIRVARKHANIKANSNADKATEESADPPTDPFPTFLVTLVLGYYFLLLVGSIGCFAVADGMLLLSYIPENLEREMQGVSGKLLSFGVLVVLMAGLALNVVVLSLPVAVRMMRRQNEEREREREGVESV